MRVVWKGYVQRFKNSEVWLLMIHPFPSFPPSVPSYWSHLEVKDLISGNNWSHSLQTIRSWGFFGVFLSREGNSRRSVHRCFTLLSPISDLGDTRDNWSLVGNLDMSWWHRYTSISYFFFFYCHSSMGSQKKCTWVISEAVNLHCSEEDVSSSELKRHIPSIALYVILVAKLDYSWTTCLPQPK